MLFLQEKSEGILVKMGLKKNERLNFKNWKDPFNQIT